MSEANELNRGEVQEAQPAQRELSLQDVQRLRQIKEQEARRLAESEINGILLKYGLVPHILCQSPEGIMVPFHRVVMPGWTPILIFASGEPKEWINSP